MKIHAPLVLTIFLYSTVSCGAPSVETAVFSKFPPRSANHTIEVYSAALPERPFVEIGTIQTEKGKRWHSNEEAIERLKEKARQIGGDALVRLENSKHSETRQNNVTGQLHSGTVSTWRAVVIRYVE